jgi:hypothetical protein
MHYPHGYVAVVHGGSVTSRRNAAVLTVVAKRGVTNVAVTVRPRR